MTNKKMYNLYDAKTALSSLVDRAAAGEEIVIAKAGSPRAKLVPVRSIVNVDQPLRLGPFIERVRAMNGPKIGRAHV